MSCNYLNHRKGLSLGEVILSIAILASAVLASTSMLTYTMRLMKFSEHHVIATNLARAGLEMLHSKRDANWLTRSGDLRTYWNEDFAEPNLAASPLTTFYTIDSRLDASGHKYDVTITPQNNLVNLQSEDGSSVPEELEKYKLYLANADLNLYTHDTAAGNTATKYYRQLRITYEGTCVEFDTNCDCQDTGTDCNYVVADCTVFWIENGQAARVTLSTKLYDWYGRADKSYYEKV